MGARFWTFVATSCVSALGDQLAAVVVSIAVYARTGSVGLIGAMWVIKALVRIAVEPFGGIVADHVSRRTVLIGCVLLFAMTALAMAAALPRHAIAAVALVQVQQVVNTFYAPAATAIVPSIAPPDRLGTANAAFRISSNLAALAGPALAAAGYFALGPRTLMALNAATYAVLGAGIVTLPRVAPAAARTPLLVAARAGFTTTLRDPLRTRLLVIAATMSMLVRILEIGLVPLTAHTAGLHRQDLGLALPRSRQGA